MKIVIEIAAHADGVHCGHCRGRYFDGRRCAVFVVDVVNVPQAMLGAVRCEECLDAEIQQIP